MIIVFGQQFGEMQFKNKMIPWGGLLLTVTWGLAHIFTKDLATGIETVIISIAYGLIYLLMKKNIKWSYFFIALCFML